MDDTPSPAQPIPRRAVLGGSAGFAAAVAAFGQAHGMANPAPPSSGGRAGQARIERDDVGVVETAMHGGVGKIRVKWFDFGKAAQPSLLIAYVIPPGASEGVHTHRLGDRALGAYDEFYYVLEGSGVMQLGGESLSISAGDHVFAPLGVPHGIANTAAHRDLKIMLTAIERS